MSKKYEETENEPQMVREPLLKYGNHPETLHLDIDLEDDAVVADIKEAIKKIKGIASVRIAEKKSEKNNHNPFDELDTTWGGAADANDIADELHAMRSDLRTIEPW